MIEKKLLKIILLGAPGSGKGTLAQKLCEHNFVQISTGDLFRQKLKQDDAEAKLIQSLINRGELISDEIVNKLALDAILNASKQNKNIILDGYPRTIDQAKYLASVTNVDFVFYLNVDEKILFERITGRLTCSQCQKIYNSFSNPPKQKDVCDDCLIPLTKRRDDNEESFVLRMHEYKTKTYPLIDFYKKDKNTKFIELNQDKNTSTEQLLDKVINIFNINE